MTRIEFRHVSERVPRGLFRAGEVRYNLGEARTRQERLVLEQRRELLKALARRGQWDTLHNLKTRKTTIEELERIANATGIDTIAMELRSTVALPSFDELVPQWLESIVHVRSRSAYSYGAKVLLGCGMRPEEVTRHDVNEWVRVLRANGSAQNTIASFRTSWSAFFTWLIEREHDAADKAGRIPSLVSNPARGAKPTPTHSTRHRFFSEDEFAALLDVTIPAMKAQYSALLFCGLRRDEFMFMPPAHVTDSYIRVAPTDDFKPKGYPRVTRGVRDIPVHRTRLLPLLQEYRHEWAGEERFFVNPITAQPWTQKPLYSRMRLDCKAAGIRYGRDGGVTPHTCRHTLASWLAQRDVQLLKIAHLLGDTVDTVARFYAHLLPSDLDETINEAL